MSEQHMRVDADEIIAMTEEEPQDWEGPAEPLPDGSPAEAEDSKESPEGGV